MGLRASRLNIVADMPTIPADAETAADPIAPDWKNLVLPDTWPDALDLSGLPGLFSFFRSVLGKRARVAVPENLHGNEHIPKYALQEFHNLPNGNYSNSLTPGYIKGFDYSMLNTVEPVRQRLAQALAKQESVLDIGCAGGKTAAAVKNAGVTEVWGLDPSPYLLQHAARTFGNIRFIQGKAENTGFRDARFGGISACFVFHEIPPRYADEAMKELHRILQPGGILAIAEPSAIQYYETSWLKLLRDWGWHGIYFRILAHFVFEPFINSWHQRDTVSWLNSHGFEVISDQDACPIRTIIARKKIA